MTDSCYKCGYNDFDVLRKDMKGRIVCFGCAKYHKGLSMPLRKFRAFERQFPNHKKYIDWEDRMQEWDFWTLTSVKEAQKIMKYAWLKEWDTSEWLKKKLIYLRDDLTPDQ